MFEKIWYIKIDGEVEGPYSVQQLRHHPRVTPDTLAQKKGWLIWRPIRVIYELRAVFEDAEPLIPEQKPIRKEHALGEAVLDMRGEFPPVYFWIILLICLLLYCTYVQIYQK